ncbi:MAG TPA: NAD(P)-dependent oxidoreductase [Solirubrobacterales bacterium]
MRVFFAGASGAIGPVLTPRLVEAGHEVVALTRTPSKAERLAADGADPVVCDVLDTAALRDAVVSAKPDAVVHHLTDLPQQMTPGALKVGLEATNRVRTEGTANLIDAAREAGARRIVAQSIAFAYAPKPTGLYDESDPLYVDAPTPGGEAAGAVAELERQVTNADGLAGVALRFGFWYGPRTAYAPDGHWAAEVRRRRLPIVGAGSAVWSFVHVDDVAAATLAALERGDPGVYNIADDDPAPAREWIPAYAEAVGAKPPRRVPTLLVRMVAGRYAVFLSRDLRGASNEKAKRELGFEPRWPSWRRGFSEALG